MFVKICGVTRAEDAEAAVAHGAGAIGFVFWPSSPRFVDPDRARAIAALLPPFVTAVGVFVNQAPGEINRIAARVGLGAVQLHGDETPDDAARIDRPVVKALPMTNGVEAAVTAWPARVMLLLDAYDEARRGGTGRTVDWTVAAAIAGRRPVLLAGGLRPENVEEAVARVHPFGLDVSSGVEREPGVKDHARLAALFEAIAGSRPPSAIQTDRDQEG
jgi:phosphoribosylanthranilate isomerase